MRANELLREQSDKLSLEELKAAIDGGQAPRYDQLAGLLK